MMADFFRTRISQDSYNIKDGGYQFYLELPPMQIQIPERCGICGNDDSEARHKVKNFLGLGWVCMDSLLCDKEKAALPFCVYCCKQFFDQDETCPNAPPSSDGTRFHEEGVVTIEKERPKISIEKFDFLDEIRKAKMQQMYDLRSFKY